MSTIKFDVNPLNSHGQASVDITGGDTESDYNAATGQMYMLTPSQYAELVRRLHTPTSSEAEPGEAPPIAWHPYDDVVVALTRSVVDGSIIVHLESVRPLNPEHGGKDALPVRVTRNEDNEVIYDGNLA